MAQSSLWDFGATGIFEPKSCELVAGFSTRAQADQAILGLESLYEERRWSAVLVDDLDVEWQPHQTKSQIRVDTPGGGQTIDIEAGQAFGHGRHPTTRLALELITCVVRPGNLLLDVGTGTGVLAIAATVLGASAVAIDIDEGAVATALKNAATNNVDVACSTAKVDQVLANYHEGFDVVVVNVLFPIHVDLHHLIIQALRDGGHLITTGFLESQLGSVRALYQELSEDDSRFDGDWAGLAWSKK